MAGVVTPMRTEMRRLAINMIGHQPTAYLTMYGQSRWTAGLAAVGLASQATVAAHTLARLIKLGVTVDVEQV
jgi:hypothetical protein